LNLISAVLTTFTTILVKFQQCGKSFNPSVMNGKKSIPYTINALNPNEIEVHLSEEINIKEKTILFLDESMIEVNYNRLFKQKEFNDRYYYPGKLGFSYSPSKTEFKVWSPVATNISVLLYINGDPVDNKYPLHKISMIESKGLWSAEFEDDLRHYFYTYEVTVYDKTTEVIDPYAISSGINGYRAAIIDINDTNPDKWDKDISPSTIKNFTDAIIYEINIRDMSIHPQSGIKHKGQFLGLCEDNTCSNLNNSTGLAHIKSLGVTHVQIMPMYDISYKSIDEENPRAKYNWGYDPQNYNIPEGSYSTNPYNPIIRIKEMKTMIQSFHTHGLCVNMDVVYNHIYKIEESSFHGIFPGYYFRYKDDGTPWNGSACSNDTASEHLMMRKFIKDSVLYWAQEYHLDGFRFDLMGLHDITTINELRAELNNLDRPIMMYGEGWNLDTGLDSSEKAQIANAFKTPIVGYFNDIIRDALKGAVFLEEDFGFVSGKNGLEETIKHCVVGGVKIDGFNNPHFSSLEQSINYVSCHDNHTLWDKLLVSAKNATESEILDMHKLALAIIITAQGIPFIHSGCEFCRTKNGIENTFSSPDYINWMDWERKLNFASVVDYVRELIRLRKYHLAFRFSDASKLNNHISFINSPKNTVAFILKDNANGDKWKDILIIYNANRYDVNMYLPEGQWNLIGNKHTVELKSLANNISGNFNVNSIGIAILYR